MAEQYHQPYEMSHQDPWQTAMEARARLLDQAVLPPGSPHEQTFALYQPAAKDLPDQWHQLMVADGVADEAWLATDVADKLVITKSSLTKSIARAAKEITVSRSLAQAGARIANALEGSADVMKAEHDRHALTDRQDAFERQFKTYFGDGLSGFALPTPEVIEGVTHITHDDIKVPLDAVDMLKADDLVLWPESKIERIKDWWNVRLNRKSMSRAEQVRRALANADFAYGLRGRLEGNEPLTREELDNVRTRQFIRKFNKDKAAQQQE